MKKFNLYLLIYISTLSYTFAQSPDFTWWNKKHNWDGVSPWSSYIIASSRYMGPNALPVPDVRGAYLTDSSHVVLSYQQHGGFGDNTINLFTEIFINTIPKRIAFSSWVVPIEKFKMDSLTRDERACREYSGKGLAGGDIYFASFINLLEEKKFIPQATLECVIKTASGTNLANARFTDAPGYWFNLHTSKKLYTLKNYTYWINLNTGFYSWQTNMDKHRQNDAFVYGLSVNMKHPLFVFTAGIKGYMGYILNGDCPVVLFLNGNKNYGPIKLNLTLSYGLQDYPYQSVSLGIAYYPKKLNKQIIQFFSKNKQEE